MSARGLAVLLASLAATAFGASATAGVAPVPTLSANWAGYAVSATDSSASASDGAAAATSPLMFTDVTATWVEPRVRCIKGASAGAAFWIGLGGANESSESLQQIGTTVRCAASGAATHSAWYEIVPAPDVPIKLTIAAGDTITAAVLAEGTTVTLQLTNRTRQTRFTRRLAVPAADLTSAEWIVEPPPQCTSSGTCERQALANFGVVTFTRAAATANGQPGVISAPTWTASPIALVPGRLHALPPGTPQPGSALASPVTADGRSFSVGWHPAVVH